MKIKEFINNELSGWKLIEIVWLVSACLIIMGLSIYWKDSFMGIVSAVTGVACVICTGKGKLSAYIFGLVNCVLYAIISYKAKLYGETMLNAIYYVPMQFVGFYIWSKNINKETKEVKKIHMTNKVRLFWLVIMVVSTIVYGFVLKLLGDAMPFVDSFTTVSSVVAMIVSVRMYSEQWWIWLLVDVFTVYMWFTNFIYGQENMATLLMCIVYLANAVIMCIKWEKEVISNNKKEVISNGEVVVENEV